MLSGVLCPHVVPGGEGGQSGLSHHLTCAACLGRTPHIFRVGFPQLHQAGDNLTQEGPDVYLVSLQNNASGVSLPETKIPERNTRCLSFSLRLKSTSKCFPAGVKWK